MTDITLFVGLDVHKKTVAVALVDAAAGSAVRFAVVPVVWTASGENKLRLVAG